MDENPAISKRIAFAFHPKYTLSEKQLMKYRNDLGSYDIESDEIDDALEFSREKLKDVLRNIGVNQEQQPDQPQQPPTETVQQQPDQQQQPGQQAPPESVQVGGKSRKGRTRKSRKDRTRKIKSSKIRTKRR